jgi:hypothetical protein
VEEAEKSLSLRRDALRVDHNATHDFPSAEPEAAEYAQLIADDPAPLISVASIFAAGIILISRHGLAAWGGLQDGIE